MGRGAEGMTVLVIMAVTMTSCSLLVPDPGGTSEQASGWGSISPMIENQCLPPVRCVLWLGLAEMQCDVMALLSISMLRHFSFN